MERCGTGRVGIPLYNAVVLSNTLFACLREIAYNREFFAVKSLPKSYHVRVPQ